MSKFFIHLLLSAYVAPVIGCLVLAVLTPFLQVHQPEPTISLAAVFIVAIPAAVFAPWLTWYIFVPLACGSFLFFRLTATSHRRSLLFWIVAWCLIGTISSNIFAVATGNHTGLRSLAFFGFLGLIVGALVAPLHRRLWLGL